MVENLSEARRYANRVRFSADVVGKRLYDREASTTLREIQYQDAIEISAALTPVLWRRLNSVCSRLLMPPVTVAAFIYSSPNVQAECLASGGNECTIRFSSAMLDLLSDEEFEFVVGHEIGHFLLDHQPIKADQSNPQVFVQQRGQEISADRLGLLACESLEIALRALMKTVSGLTEKHLRFDVAAFIGQLKRIEGVAPDWSWSTHPSIVIRAKALLWFTLTGILDRSSESFSSEEIAKLDLHIERDLQRYVDGAAKKKVDESRKDLLLWMLTYESIQSESLVARLQEVVRRLFDDSTADKLNVFIEGLTSVERDDVVFEKVRSARAQLESLIPQTFDSEIERIQSRIKLELN